MRAAISGRAVGNEDLSRVQGIADSHAAAIVNRNPACTARGIEQGIQQRPIGHRIGAIAHFFGFAERRGDRAAIEVIASDHDGRLQFSARDQIVERNAEFFALPIAEPADAGGQSLKAHALLRERNPAAENFIPRKHFEDEFIGAMNIGSFAREREPSEMVHDLRRIAAGCKQAQIPENRRRFSRLARKQMSGCCCHNRM